MLPEGLSFSIAIWYLMPKWDLSIFGAPFLGPSLIPLQSCIVKIMVAQYVLIKIRY